MIASPSRSIRAASPHYRFQLGKDLESTRDIILVALWFLVTFKQFRFDELLLYPLAVYFAWAFIRDFTILFPTILRSLILFAFPFWWLLSALWGAETGLIIKSGTQLMLTMMICIYASQRVSARQFMFALMIIGTVFAVSSLMAGILGTSTHARGVFKSKNAMGLAMVIMWIATLCVFFDPRMPKVLRWIMVPILILNVRQILAAHSATAVLLSAAMFVLVLVVGVLPRTGFLRRPSFYIASLPIVAAILVFLGLIFATQEVDPIDSVLAAFGKDTTLTGRTELWSYAIGQIKDNPFLGVGAGGFWTPYDGSSLARRIYEDFYKSLNSTFSFHNSFFEIAVHQGLIGVCLVILQVLWSCTKIIRNTVQNHGMPAVFFLCIAAFTVTQSITESNLMTPFSLPLMLTTIGALLSVNERLSTHSTRQ